MNCKTWLVLIFLSAEAIFVENDVEVESERLQIPSVNAKCHTKDLTAKCCATLTLPTGSKETACVTFTIPRNELAVNVKFSFNDKSLGHFTLGENLSPICASLPIVHIQFCLSPTYKVKLRNGYAKICSALLVRFHSITLYHVVIPCLEYKNKKFSILT